MAAFLLLATGAGALAPPAHADTVRAVAHSPNPQQSETQRPAANSEAPITGYALPPDRLQQAIELARSDEELYFAEFAVSIIAMLILLRTRVPASFAGWAGQASRFRIVQALVFTGLFLTTLALCVLPLHVIGHVLGLRYQLSVESWGPWLLDWCKGQGITIAVATLIVWIAAALLRRDPRRWWIWAWVIALPLIVFGAFVEPVLIEPLFYQFQPLAQTHPQLATDIQQLAARAGAQIPENHIYEMLASRKLNELNAYVSGIGASKRVVLWDTLLARMNNDEVLLVVGHELGHYVLGHVWKGIVISAIGLFFGLWLLAALLRWTLQRWGEAWNIAGIQQWSVFAVLWLIASLMTFASTPLDNAISRYFEHQADVFGIELAHGLVPDVSQAAAHADQILGEVDLEEPDPSPFTVFWFDDHPPIAQRIQFDLRYDPWAPGHSPEFIKK